MIKAPFTDKTRLYVQLQPSQKTLQDLCTIRDAMTHGRPVDDNELHLTVIHIGELSRLIAAFPEIDPGKILKAAEQCALRLEDVASQYRGVDFSLKQAGLEPFGKTIAATYESSEMLAQLHANALRTFTTMFNDLGIEEPLKRMEQDANLRYALTLRPHVSLRKGAQLTSAPSAIRHGKFTLMKIIY